MIRNPSVCVRPATFVVLTKLSPHCCDACLLTQSHLLKPRVPPGQCTGAIYATWPDAHCLTP